VIAAQGLAALRARGLADAVGCSVGAIYTVFSDLDALILAVNGRTLAAIDDAMTAASSAADPIEHLVRLARAYLDYAAGAKLLWAALFQHAMPAGRAVSDWYARQQEAAFSHIEVPLARLLPAMPAPERALLARSLFSAVHGMVALGLDEKVAAMPLPVLGDQIATVVTAAARELAR
jgi:AcrR family transcriptional regulator